MCCPELLKGEVGKLIEGKLHAHQHLSNASSLGERHAHFTECTLTYLVRGVDAVVRGNIFNIVAEGF